VAEDMIRLEHLTKVFPGSGRGAVVDLSLRVTSGQIAVLVGPSGCGKTTTMRMVNRMIQPTSGRIVIDGVDATERNADDLRRHIGYVIQQVGLFPHMTIAQNVATVPRLLKWDTAKTRARVDEMLDVVGLDPSVYRDRYPKQLSGGQQQRVGVARALCADPPVMLMDEPFGAIDPITRERLQNEFLRLQSELRKTIVFVTHDIDEAIKLGDRIAIMREDSQVAQYDTPANILAAPADAFVREFIGSRTTLRQLGLIQVSSVYRRDWPVLTDDQSVGSAGELLRTSGVGVVLVVDGDQRPLRWVTAADVEGAASLASAGVPVTGVLAPEAALADVLDALLAAHQPAVAIIDGSGRHAGVVDLPTVLAAAGRLATTEQSTTELSTTELSTTEEKAGVGSPDQAADQTADQDPARS